MAISNLYIGVKKQMNEFHDVLSEFQPMAIKLVCAILRDVDDRSEFQPSHHMCSIYIYIYIYICIYVYMHALH